MQKFLNKNEQSLEKQSKNMKQKLHTHALPQRTGKEMKGLTNIKQRGCVFACWNQQCSVDKGIKKLSCPAKGREPVQTFCKAVQQLP